MKPTDTSLPKLLLCAALALPLSGCIIDLDRDGNGWDDWDWRDEQESNQRRIDALEMGQSETIVVDTLGTPDFTEAFVRDGESFRVLFYRTHRVHEDGRTSKDETTPVVFADGRLVGWGDTAVERAAP